MSAFSAIAKAALKPGALDGKNKGLIALGISVAMRCDDCIGFHVKVAIEKGASREEVLETKRKHPSQTIIAAACNSVRILRGAPLLYKRQNRRRDII